MCIFGILPLISDTIVFFSQNFTYGFVQFIYAFSYYPNTQFSKHLRTSPKMGTGSGDLTDYSWQPWSYGNDLAVSEK
jgi:hypothetical protein